MIKNHTNIVELYVHFLLQAIGRKLVTFVFLKCCTGKEKVAPTDYDKVEDIHNTLYKKEKLTSQKDIREDQDEHEEVTWQILSLLQDRLCLYVYTITIIILIIFFMLALYGFV